MFGIEDFTAIINPPEAAILAIAKMVDSPVVVDGELITRPLIHFTIGADHRINDGLRAARFLNDLKETLENPYLLLL
jgi:pyruvate dehydrogenase E2 component (dihydrolipoamide acetyltransferase)